MTDRVFYTTTEAVSAVKDALRGFASRDFEGGERILHRQATTDPDVFEFMGVNERSAWSIVLNLSKLSRGDLDAIRARMREQLKAQAGTDKPLEQRF